MPAVILDGRSYEGKKAGATFTILSGHYHNHRELAKLVGTQGWPAVGSDAHSEKARPAAGEADGVVLAGVDQAPQPRAAGPI